MRDWSETDGTLLSEVYDYDAATARLIAETDGSSGETLREYVWLGLMPIAVISPTEDVPQGECDPDLMTALEAELTAANAAADALTVQIADWDGNVAFRLSSARSWKIRS